MPKYEVRIRYKASTVFVVEADNEEDAAEKANELWANGHDGRQQDDFDWCGDTVGLIGEPASVEA